MPPKPHFLLNAIERCLSYFLLLLAESQAVIARVKIRKFSLRRDPLTELYLQNEALRYQLQMVKTANALLCQKLRKQKTPFTFTDKIKILVFVRAFGIPARKIKQSLPLSRRTIERWMKQLHAGLFHLIPKSRKPRSGKKTPKAIETLVCTMKKENPSWGYVRLSAELLKLGVYRAPNTIKAILKRNGHVPEPIEEAEEGETITTHRPHFLLSMDITTVRLFHFIPIHIFCIIDDFSRCILSYAVSFRPTSVWVTDVVKRTFEKFTIPQSILTDNGAQFVSNDFKHFLKSYSIDHRRCRPYHPNTNGKIERFFKSLKHELLNYFLLTSTRQLNMLMEEYIAYYNHHRPHQGIDNEIPAEKLEGKIKRLKRARIHEKISVQKITFAGMLHAYIRRAA